MSSFHSTPIEKYEISIRLLKTLRITCFVNRGEIKISKLSNLLNKQTFLTFFLLNYLSSLHGGGGGEGGGGGGVRNAPSRFMAEKPE